MRWSDGTALTAVDVLFNMQDFVLNEEWGPVPEAYMAGGEPVAVTRIDDHTVEFAFAELYGTFLLELASLQRLDHLFYQKRFCGQFHPDHATDLEALLAEAGLDDRRALMLQECGDTYQNPARFANPDRPSLEAWIVTEEAYLPGATRVVLERNPYFWAVDSAGRPGDRPHLCRPRGADAGRDQRGQRLDLSQMSDAQLRRPWREIRTVFQDPLSSFNPRMTVGQILTEPLRVMAQWDAAQTQKRVAHLLDMVGLPASAVNKYPHAFSGGQRQRISIARAIAPQPRVVIADEATSALDVNTRMQILDLMLRLQEELRLSYILISQDLSVIRYFCDRVAVMYRGRLVEIGPTEQVCAAPSHAYTQALLRAVPVADPSQRPLRSATRGLVDA